MAPVAGSTRNRCAAGLLRRAEVDAVGVPLHEVRLLVEAVGDRFRRPAGAGNYGQPRVRVEELRIAHCRREDDRFPIRREAGVVVRAALRDDLRDRLVGQRQQVDVRRAALNQIRIDRRAEDDPRAVGRPGERPDGEVLALRPLVAGRRALSAPRRRPGSRAARSRTPCARPRSRRGTPDAPWQLCCRRHSTVKAMRLPSYDHA